MKLAQFFSEWSKDPRTKVGAVIIGENGQVLSQGYNGFPRGIKDVVMLETKVNDWTESTTLAKEMFEESGVKFEILELSDLYE